MGLSASAPGKLMLSGEYAVLDGAPAIVVAVDARAIVSLHPAADDAPMNDAPSAGSTKTAGASPPPPEVRATWDLARERFPELPSTPPVVDVSALRDPSGAQKLGLGSSAAAAAATAALALSLAGLPPDATAQRDLLFELAFRGHRVIAPEGSGADVAASSLGGYLRFEPAVNGPSDLPRCASLTPPHRLVTRVVWTGHAARTSDLVGQVKRFQARASGAYATLARDLADAARSFADAFESSDVPAVLSLAERYHEAMAALGDAAQAPIVERHLTVVAQLAREAGGRAKPSGAGGGDVAIAFFGSEADAQRFEALVERAGFELLALALGAPGPQMS